MESGHTEKLHTPENNSIKIIDEKEREIITAVLDEDGNAKKVFWHDLDTGAFKRYEDVKLSEHLQNQEELLRWVKRGGLGNA